ncbi:MAG: hypothetical protein GYA17_15475 [Chloroflexi bacterium]|jgi:uncharacterized protein YjeT (DUF2065 family)|nr:hypothetical protein [Anaerolineaceae bacterium]NMB89759.1 hypothetical protein [Chloroflexota bacterium]
MWLFRRIGTFFILLGVGLIGLFIFSDVADTPTCNLLLYGIGAILVGTFLLWTNPPPPPDPTNRFRLLKKRKKERQQDERRPH